MNFKGGKKSKSNFSHFIIITFYTINVITLYLITGKYYFSSFETLECLNIYYES